ncbi:MAG: hypothetical protein M0D55_04865 [Elusimicrobiota bacterium]|nr:MAG: hypothetical protein M0D55_04865 [Elusimicrobiota bacterium]
MKWELLKRLRWRSGKSLLPLCAGSGLARVPGGFWVIADDMNHVVHVPDGAGPGRGRRLFPGVLPSDAASRKRVKKDLESLIDLGAGKLVAFPSGSKDRRCRGSLITLSSSGAFKKAVEINFRSLMTILGDVVPDLNIEGGFVRGKRLILLQRGNGRAGFSGVVKMRLSAFLRGMKKGSWKESGLGLKIKRVRLGSWGKVPLTFTDGFFLDGRAYFSAAAEAGKDTYLDGKVSGSVIGSMKKGGKPTVLAKLAGRRSRGSRRDA